jgi:hypothetical protein
VKLTKGFAAEKMHTLCAESSIGKKVQTVSAQLPPDEKGQSLTGQLHIAQTPSGESMSSACMANIASGQDSNRCLDKSETFLRDDAEITQSQTGQLAASFRLIWSHYVPTPGIMPPGNATLLSGEGKNANREIGVPRKVRP